MRGSFLKTLTELAASDRRVLLLTGDLGFMAVEPFSERFPDRFWNMGVAEQNMVGVATGLAESGFLPFVYSIVTFATLRPYEFIRNGPVLHHLPVRIVGVGGGFEYGTAGPTHHGLEDVAVMRALPGMTIVAPADHQQAAAALRATWDLPGPVYYRLGKDDRAVVPGLDGKFRFGTVDLVRSGDRVLFLTLGPMAAEACRAADELAPFGVAASVGVVATAAPAPVDAIADLAERHDLIVTVEAHSVNGGLGSLVCEVVAERGIRTRIVRCGARGVVGGSAGGERWHWERNGLTAPQLATSAMAALRSVTL